MSSQSYTLDVTFQPIAHSKINLKSPVLHTAHQLCAKHEKEAAEKNRVGDMGENVKVETKKRNSKMNVLKKIFGKGSLERKLEYHGIKLKVPCNRKRRVQPLDGEMQDDKKFLIFELRYFTASQLSTIIETFKSKINFLTKELNEITEEHERLADDQKGLKLTVRNLEEMALRVMKPWFNSMPHSDEMTRVMLLN